MSKTSRFFYVTFIRAAPQKVWDALTQPEQTRLYWHGVTQVSDWIPGADWKMTFADGRIADAGRVVEVDPPRRLVLEWRNEFMPELKAEGFSRCTIEISEEHGVTRLAVTHEIDVEGSKLIEAVSGGWPRILSSLKSLLETGAPLGETPN
ncbi:MAG TPA: SRPBCC family protein [Caulobacteraceae bacterium]|jgi:uncharacterized protein YndB with AHSA1/START domain|nr:SRPBCC family protein [Caulobacteraceae bacterium]